MAGAYGNGPARRRASRTIPYRAPRTLPRSMAQISSDQEWAAVAAPDQGSEAYVAEAEATPRDQPHAEVEQPGQRRTGHGPQHGRPVGAEREGEQEGGRHGDPGRLGEPQRQPGGECVDGGEQHTEAGQHPPQRLDGRRGGQPAHGDRCSGQQRAAGDQPRCGQVGISGLALTCRGFGQPAQDRAGQHGHPQHRPHRHGQPRPARRVMRPLRGPAGAVGSGRPRAGAAGGLCPG